jgi:hypothetical protein
LTAKRLLTGRRRSTNDNILLGFIILLSAAKVISYSERVALIDLFIPVVVLVGGMRRRTASWALAPVLIVGLLIFFFTITEYLRSWAYHANGPEGLFDYAMQLMIGYYMTAINNGAFLYSEAHSYFFPIFTARWLWHLPIPGFADHLTALTGAKVDVRGLLSGLNFEYNNTSGIFAPLIDFGPILGVLVWIGLGYVSGRLYRRFSEGHPLGIILFPTWFVGVLEMPRIFFWGDGIYFPPLAVSLFVV